MTINRVELIVRRRLVKAFIDSDAIAIQLARRQERTKTAAGGWTTTEAPALPSQVVRIIPSKRRYDNGLVNAEAGQLPNSEYLLLGSHNLDVMVDDIFLWNSSQYRVTGILPNTEERTLCSISYFGPPNG